MDDRILKKGIQALQWESYYRKKNGDDKSILKHFLSPQTELDPEFEKYFRLFDLAAGKILDVGTGTGELAIILAKKGFEVTATDVSPSAINIAKDRAMGDAVKVNFLVDNILQSRLTDQFDIIIDRGCYTLIPPEYKQDYLRQIKKLLKPKGLLFIKSDNKKERFLRPILEDMDFTKLAFEQSTYLSLSGKVISAVTLIVRKVS
jgi:2-polyprenyl-3-methyl-5-hydroxy-6-metoxy-1,4-benzoquinol methylase